ncbi:MAG: transcription-repair coupling factor, partial [Phormidesmis sp. CAN_BIN36]|nr:transcription-repair coupling factor [Phormidesmis sp. CAN_BIN36]
MAFSSITRALGRLPLTAELLNKLSQQQFLRLSGLARLPKGLVSSTLAQAQTRPLLVVTATLEEAGRWSAQLEAMGWQTVHFYPTSETSPYESFDPEAEMNWGQLQVLADLVKMNDGSEKPSLAIVSTERALQTHLPPVEAFTPYCLSLDRGKELNLNTLSNELARLGYERVNLVETEGQWSRRGDIIDVFPVAAELPVRLELFGDELDQIREFDPSTQRSLDSIDRLVLTPTSFSPIIQSHLTFEQVESYLSPEDQERFEQGHAIEGMRRFLGLAFSKPASLLDYLPDNTLIALDEPEMCEAHGDRWFDQVEEHWQEISHPFPKTHRSFAASLAEVECFDRLFLSELAEEKNGLNLASRPVPAVPHQFGRLAETLRGERDRGFSVWLVSAQPSRSVSLLQEHDCPAQFVP